MTETLIIIPAKDEEATVGEVVGKVKSYGFSNILVISDGSIDQTGAVAKRSGAKVAELPISIGAWGAMQTGFRYALRKGYRSTVTLDADDQHDARHIKDLLDMLEGSDVVIGGCLGRCSFLKKLLIVLFKKLSGLEIEDLTSGFRAYSREAMQILCSKEGLVLDYQDVGVLLLLKKRKITIKETPVCMAERQNGKSKIFNNYLSISRYALSTLFMIGAKRW